LEALKGGETTERGTAEPVDWTLTALSRLPASRQESQSFFGFDEGQVSTLEVEFSEGTPFSLLCTIKETSLLSHVGAIGLDSRTQIQRIFTEKQDRNHPAAPNGCRSSKLDRRTKSNLLGLEGIVDRASVQFNI